MTAAMRRVSKKWCSFVIFLKFRYYEKATKFEIISHSFFEIGCVTSNQNGGFFSNCCGLLKLGSVLILRYGLPNIFRIDFTFVLRFKYLVFYIFTHLRYHPDDQTVDTLLSALSNCVEFR